MYFHDLDVTKFQGATVILDVDGTIVIDGESSVSAVVQAKLTALTAQAKVFLCSNGHRDRIASVATTLGLPLIPNVVLKPSPRVLAETTIARTDKLVVIGDKFLTDGLLAANLKAQFIKVDHVRGANEKPAVRLAYMIDRIVTVFAKPLTFLAPIWILMRPWQWVKNLLVFAPLFFAAEVLDAHKLGSTMLAGVAFCALASLIYVINDLHDVEADRAHPLKQFRPLAWESISRLQLVVLVVALIAVVILILTAVPVLLLVLLAYVFLNLVYSRYLKHWAVFDIVTIAFLYVLRIEAGGVAAAVYVSPWIILCVFFGALFLAAGKRLAESRYPNRRSVLDQYTPEIIKSIVVAAAILVVSTYSLYSVLGSKSAFQVFTVPLVAIIIFRLLLKIIRQPEAGEFPESLVVKDWKVVAMLAIWLLISFLLLY
ncbi:MAG: UbiA family prenyltransferase [Candidatus Buchananbacteria bacterium]|nr:UbiA family prenyltransferase [Candidatus Buchananbacteria bacterium]